MEPSGLTIPGYIAEEVTRQGHDIWIKHDGLARVLGMRAAWNYADTLYRLPEIKDVLIIGKLIEPEHNAKGFRTVRIQVGNVTGFPEPQDVPDRIERLFANLDETVDPEDFYFAFEAIHPFRDGNGRTGKVLLNWLNHSLDAPVWPYNKWGIRNP